MKSIFIFLVTIILCFLFQRYIELWWIFALPTFIIHAIIAKKGHFAFLQGFFAIFVLWLGYAWWLNQAGDQIISLKMGQLILGDLPHQLLLLATGFIGGLMGGFVALCGKQFGLIIRKKNKKSSFHYN